MDDDVLFVYSIICVYELQLSNINIIVKVVEETDEGKPCALFIQ